MHANNLSVHFTSLPYTTHMHLKDSLLLRYRTRVKVCPGLVQLGDAVRNKCKDEVTVILHLVVCADKSTHEKL